MNFSTNQTVFEISLKNIFRDEVTSFLTLNPNISKTKQLGEKTSSTVCLKLYYLQYCIRQFFSHFNEFRVFDYGGDSWSDPRTCNHDISNIKPFGGNICHNYSLIILSHKIFTGDFSLISTEFELFDRTMTLTHVHHTHDTISQIFQ